MEVVQLVEIWFLFQYLFFCFLGILRFILYYCGDYELAVCELVVLVVVGVCVYFSGEFIVVVQ